MVKGKKLYSNLPEYEFVRTAHEDFYAGAYEMPSQHQAVHLQETEAI